MPSPARVRRGVAGVILTLFCLAVAGAAAIGWWYARESPAHQGPIVIISVDDFPAAAVPAYGAARTDTPAIDALAADAVVFDRAYGHSPQLLPALASMLTGQLPPEHGVRDDAGFALSREAQTVAELLRNRGFTTGAAVSSFLLRPQSGVAQGFTYFNAELPEQTPGAAPMLARDGASTVAAAEAWIRTQDDQRFFVFIQVAQDAADVAVARLVSLLKSEDLYDGGTVVIVGDRGDGTDGHALTDATLRVPLLIKQPHREGAGRRVAAPVQHIDLVPTILDLVRAPLPRSLRGRSLRAVLEDPDATLAEMPVYSESLAAWYRLGGHPQYALTTAEFRFVRGQSEELISLAPATLPELSGEAASQTGRLRLALENIIRSGPVHQPEPIPAADEERFALFGYLSAPRVPLTEDVAAAVVEPALFAEHRRAAMLVGQKQYSAGIRALQQLARQRADLATVHFQTGALLVRTGRVSEAIEAFRTARQLQPQSAHLAVALADVLLRSGQAEEAQLQADEAVAIAGDGAAAVDRVAALDMAARVALARGDAAAATRYAEAAQDLDETLPIRDFVRGRLLYARGDYEAAAAAFEEALTAARERDQPFAELHLFLAESFAQLDRYAEAETHYREEMRAFPHNVQAYASLAMLYRASNRNDAVEDVLNELVTGTPTPESYAVAARLWMILGDSTRAEALRSDAQARFRGDPQPALLGRGGRR